MKRIALIIAINKDKKVLLQHKGKNAPNNPDMWCFLGGTIEQGESSEDAARREFLEELEITISNPVFFEKTEDKEKDIERSYFAIPLDMPAEVLKKQQQEGDNLGFFSLEEAKALRMNQAYLEALIKFLKTLSP